MVSHPFASGGHKTHEDPRQSVGLRGGKVRFRASEFTLACLRVRHAAAAALDELAVVAQGALVAAALDVTVAAAQGALAVVEQDEPAVAVQDELAAVEQDATAVVAQDAPAVAVQGVPVVVEQDAPVAVAQGVLAAAEQDEPAVAEPCVAQVRHVARVLRVVLVQSAVPELRAAREPLASLV